MFVYKFCLPIATLRTHTCALSWTSPFNICIHTQWSWCLSRAIQYSPPNKWIICEVGVFPVFFFLENDLSKGLKILGLMFFKTNGMSPVGEAVLWTQRFLARKILPKNRSLFMRNETKSKCLPKFYVSSKQDKEYYRKTTPYLEQPSRHVSSSFMRRKRLKPLTVPLENCHVWKFWKDL